MAFITLDNYKNYVGKMSPEQKKVLTKYFCVSGCLGSLGAMKDEDYDAMVDEKVKALNLKQKALNKIGLDESEVNEIAPVNFYGWDDDDSKNTLTGKVGRDGEYRTSRYQVSWLFFSSTQVYLYSYTIDMLFNKSSERTEEYFYKDITNFSTNSESKEYTIGKNTVTAQKAEFQIVVPGDKMRLAITGMNMEEVERSLQAMKQKLREKKM